MNKVKYSPCAFRCFLSGLFENIATQQSSGVYKVCIDIGVIAHCDNTVVITVSGDGSAGVYTSLIGALRTQANVCDVESFRDMNQ